MSPTNQTVGFHPADLNGLQAWYSADGLRSQAKKPNEIAGLQAWYRADALEEANARPFEVPAAANALPSVPGLAAWYNADDIRDPEDGISVAQWDDSSGNSRPAVQTTASKQPLLKKNIVNGHSVVRFDGTDDHLRIADADWNSLGRVGNITVFMVMDMTFPGSNFFVLGKGDGGSPVEWAIRTGAVSLSYQIYDGSTNSTFAGPRDINTGFHTVAATFGTTMTAWADGIQEGTTAVSARMQDTTDDVVICGDKAGVGGIAADVAEILIYTRALTIDERQQIERYLTRKYALDVLPSMALDIPNLHSWWNAGSISGLSDGAAVAKWYDNSGKRRTLTQPTVASQPLYKTNILNGHPVVRFDGTNDFLTTTNDGTISDVVNGNSTVFLVAKLASVVNNAAMIHGNVANPSRVFTTTTNFAANFNFQDGTAGTADTNWHILSIIWSSVGGISKEGVFTAYSQNPGFGFPFEFNLGARYDGANPTAMDVAEFIVFNRQLSASEQERVERYLSKKYAINTAIGAWPDSSGHSNNLSQATEAKKPKYVANVKNGKPSIRSDGVDDHITGTVPAVGSAHTVMFVGASRVTHPGDARLWNYAFQADVGSLNDRWIFYSDQTPANVDFGAAPVNTFAIGTIAFTSATVANAYKDGTLGSGPFNPHDTYIGQTALTFFDFTNNTAPGQFDLLEFASFDALLSDTDRRAVELYFAEKYGVQTAVQQWNDRSINANHVTPAADANAPKYVANALGGLPAVRFDGTDDRLRKVGFAGALPTGVGGLTVFGVGKRGAGLLNRFIGVTSGNNGWLVAHGNTADTDHVRYTNPGVGDISWDNALVDVNNHLFVVSHAGQTTTAREYTDGTENAGTQTTPTPIGTPLDINVGADANPSSFWDGDISEIIVYDRQLNEGERRMVERYLAGKYGLVVSPGVASPDEIFDIPNLAGWYDFSDRGRLWQDTARTVPVTTNGDVIKGVTDRSLNANHLSEATNPPTFVTSAQAGQSVSRYNGSTSVLSSAANLPGTTAPVTVITVAKSGGNVNRFICGSGSSILVGVHASTNVYQFVTPGIQSYDFAGGWQNQSQCHIHTAILDASVDVTAWRNGTAMGTVAGATPSGGPAIWSLGAVGGGAWDGDIAEVLVFSRAITDTERRFVEGYLGAKWGIPVV